MSLNVVNINYYHNRVYSWVLYSKKKEWEFFR